MLTSSPVVRGLAQFASVIAGLLFFHHIGFGGRAPPIHAAVPLFAWLPPYLIYAFWPGPRRILPCLAANIALVAVYEGLLALLRNWEERIFQEAYERCVHHGGYGGACLVGRGTLFPIPPPLHWEWAVGTYFVALPALYVFLAVSAPRTTGQSLEE